MPITVKTQLVRSTGNDMTVVYPNLSGYVYQKAGDKHRVIFFHDHNYIYGYKLDENLKIIGELMWNMPKKMSAIDDVNGKSQRVDSNQPPPKVRDVITRRFRDVAGCAIEGSNYHLFFMSENGDVLTSVTFNFDSKLVIANKIDIDLVREKFSGSISYRDKFYLFSTLRNTNQLSVYSFSDGIQYISQKTELGSDLRFNMNQANHNLSDVLSELRSIENNSVISIAQAVGNKVCGVGDSLAITVDDVDYFTSVIWIDTKTLMASLKTFPKPVVNCTGPIRSESSSFIFGGKLFQLKLCPSALGFSVTGLIDNKKIQEWKYDKGEDIKIANSFISVGKLIEQDPYLETDKEPKSSRFFRMASKGQPGISVYQTNDTLHVTMGGVRFDQNQMGVLERKKSMVKPKFYSLYDYSQRATLYYGFATKLNSLTLKHQQEPVDVSESLVSRIETFRDQQNSRNVTGHIRFRDGERMIVAYYSKTTQRLVMHEFR